MSTLQGLLGKADGLKAKLDELRPINPDREARALQKIRLWWTYHSNAIEGNKLTQGETETFLMEGLTAKGKPLKDHLDLRGHSNAINYLLGFVRSKEPLTEAAIRELHRILLVEAYQVQAVTPDGMPTMKTIALGEYKTQPNHVRTPTGEIHYYATPEETPAKMGDLMAWYRDKISKGSSHAIEIAAHFHHRFTEIHPFDDGNGRMSRLLMNLMLMQQGFPPTVIRLNERDRYLAALREADQGQIENFFVLIAEHVIHSLHLYLSAANGEEIHEPTDLEKEIALLKLELSHIEEPLGRTLETTRKLFVDSFDLMFAELIRRTSLFCELFSQSEVVVNVNYTSKSGNRVTELRFPMDEGGKLSARVDSYLSNGNEINQTTINVQFKGFKKGKFDAFDSSLAAKIAFDAFKYTVHLKSNPPLDIQHFYQEMLSPEEIESVTEQAARYFYNFIRKKTSGQS